MTDPELSEIGRAIVATFPPSGFGARADIEISHRIKDVTTEPEPHVSELVESGVMVETHVPEIDGPGWCYYALTAKGRLLREAMTLKPVEKS